MKIFARSEKEPQQGLVRSTARAVQLLLPSERFRSFRVWAGPQTEKTVPTAPYGLVKLVHP
jgi:hypothetical protein